MKRETNKMLEKNVQTFIAGDCEYKEADLVLFGAPFDGTTSFRPGTRFGPNAIRNESFGIETYSPYQDLDLVDVNLCDIGDLDLPFGNPRKALDHIQEITRVILNDHKLPIMLGGEHLITLGAFEAVYEKYPDVCVIHLDAHTDLRETYIGEQLSHSAVIKRVWDLVGDDRIYQFGIRSGERYEFEFAKEHTHLQKFDLEGFKDVVEKLKDKPVYFTLDLDVLDPSIFCGTGTPEAGGITYMELQKAVMQLAVLNIVGCDINELAPMYDASGTSTAVACKITREIILAINKR